MDVKASEADVLRGARKLLACRRFLHARINAGKFRVGSAWITGAPEGWSDIIGMVPGSGRFLAVECKAPGMLQALTPAQEAFLDTVNAAGGVGIVVDDLGALDRVLLQLLAEPWSVCDIYGRRIE